MDNFVGTYSTSFGVLKLKKIGQLIIGDYRNIGMLQGTYNSTTKTLTGFFINGSQKGRFSFKKTESGFDGLWAWGNAELREKWEGTQLSTEAPELANFYAEGTYETDHGQLRLHQQGNAVFGDYKHVGIIEGKFNESSKQVVGRFTNGHKKGRIVLNLTDTGFKGKWAWDNNTPRYQWNGTKISWKQPELSTYTKKDTIHGKNQRALLVVSMLNVTSKKYRFLYQFLDKAGMTLALQMLSNNYKTIATLKDDKATLSRFTAELANLADDPDIREIDVIMHCHGLKNGLSFANGTVNSDTLKKELKALGLGHRLRMFYTTACYGGDMLDGIIEGGFSCANGARGVNANSPTEYPEFLLRWRNKQTFHRCITESYNSFDTKLLDKVASLKFDNVDSRKRMKGDTAIKIGSTRD